MYPCLTVLSKRPYPVVASPAVHYTASSPWWMQNDYATNSSRNLKSRSFTCDSHQRIYRPPSICRARTRNMCHWCPRSDHSLTALELYAGYGLGTLHLCHSRRGSNAPLCTASSSTAACLNGS